MSSERRPELSEVIRRALDGALRDVRVAMPAKVVKVHSSGGNLVAIDCKPLVKEAILDEEDKRVAESLPVVPNVPVHFPAGGGFRATFPVAVGDFVTLIFAGVSLDKWLTGKGGEVDPEFDHRHSLADAIAIPGIWPTGAPLASCPLDEATIGKDDGVQIHMSATEITVGDKAGSDFVALAGKVLSELQAIQSAFSGHTHAAGSLMCPNTGTGNPVAVTGAGGTGNTYSPSSVAASQAKAK